MDTIDRFLAGLGQNGRVAGRPRVTLSYAQSLDGSIAARRGKPLAISSQEALEATHQLRAAHQGILVGIGTVLADDPRLTVRMANGSNPQPIVLDSRLRTPPQAALFSNGGTRPWIVTTPGPAPARRQALEQAGARILPVEANPERRVSLTSMLQELQRRGIQNLMVEGGARVITAFLAQGLVDNLWVTVAPVFVGGQRSLERLLLERQGVSDGNVPSGLRPFPRLREMQVDRMGRDLVIWGTLEWERS